jgi:hypothetical protein
MPATFGRGPEHVNADCGKDGVTAGETAHKRREQMPETWSDRGSPNDRRDSGPIPGPKSGDKPRPDEQEKGNKK